MGGFSLIVLLLGNLLLLLKPCSTLPLCTDLTGAFKPNTTLTFCTSYTGKTCCDSAEDSALQQQFQAMNITDPGCAAVVTSILCAKCDPFSAELFRVKTSARSVPVLCNSTVSANSTQSTQASANFCSQVWGQCSNISIVNSPFAASLQGQAGTTSTSNSTKITQYWQSQSNFCSAFGGASLDDSVCFDGTPVTFNSSATLSFPSGMCLEQIGNGSYINMVAHPDGSSRAFFSNQQGHIWLAILPAQGSGKMMQVDVSSPFLDISDLVSFDTEMGLEGIAAHPNFAQNGRFFASFNCDKSQWPGCAGRCSCNSAVNCDPSKLSADNGALPCQYQSVISEFTANGTSPNISAATSAQPIEVRRILTMGLPFTTHHGGQILFGPADGYLYFMMGDGGGVGDPYNFAQNKKTLLGKILRLDVDNIPTAAEISQLGLWGNYSIPSDNPYTEDTALLPEIWAMGFRNPWKCSFDSSRPAYFMCGDVGQDTYESVDMITKDGNYGWRVYEGPYLYTPLKSPGGNTSANSIREIFPVMGYNHSSVNQQQGSASITGGYFYRSMTDACMYGSYIYADLFGAAMFSGIENPEDSGNFNQSLIPFTCASDSPIPCTFVNGSTVPSLGYVLSFGEDNNNDIYLLASSGVYRIVSPSRCNYACSKEVVTPPSPSPSPSPTTSTPSQTSCLSLPKNAMLLCSSLLLILLGFI
ncbi:HIPL1 protein-like [Rhododendron vialii]|uniref:HIPL1 protein-like n=1 Tax=Rhododendron vialii TaxID=182163 RepID=UPI00265EA624|nr:HIPL1 protein-like [Rhododendron vialii]